MDKRLEQAIAEADEIEAAEADQTDRPIPPHVKVSRPNRAPEAAGAEAAENLDDKLARIAAEAEAAEEEPIRRLMDAEAREAENAPDEDDGAPLPPHVAVSRPNWAQSKTLQVRLNPDEYEALERLAADRGLPMSTIARAQLLHLLDESTADSTSDQSQR